MKKNTAIPKTVHEYLAAVPEPARSTLKKVRTAIRSAAPAEATEVISYGIPMFKYKGMLMGYAAYRKHCSLFLATSSLLEKVKDQLLRYQTSNLLNLNKLAEFNIPTHFLSEHVDLAPGRSTN